MKGTSISTVIHTKNQVWKELIQIIRIKIDIKPVTMNIFIHNFKFEIGIQNLPSSFKFSYAPVLLF